MISFLASAVAIIVVLGALIFFHELGHFLVARLLGMGVSVFSLGFGKRLAGFRHGKTDYRVCLCPLGGYVQLVGESADAELPEGFSAAESFSLRPALQRMLVVLAGPVFNFIMAWLLLWGLIWQQGVPEVQPVIGQFLEGSAAQEAGLEVGDRILEIDGATIRVWDELVDRIEHSEGHAMRLLVQRGDERFSVQVTPTMREKKTLFGETISRPMLGFGANTVEVRHVGFWAAAGEGAWGNVWSVKTICWLTVEGLKKLIQRIIPVQEMGGVILISKLIHDGAQEGLASLLYLTALISINLGILNLLPIPMLDGGHILFFGLEALFRRPLPEKVQGVAMKLGMSFLLLLMVVTTANDIWRFSDDIMGFFRGIL